jgi:putative membrane protein
MSVNIHRRTILLASLLPAGAFAQETRGRDDELQHVAATLAYGAASLDASRLAIKKTTRPSVRRFAEFEIAEQDTLAALLNEVGAARNSIPPQREPKIEEKADLKRMEGLSQGFDQAYVGAQVKGHRELLELQERYLQRGQEPVFKAIATLTRGHIKEHLTVLEALQSEVS